MSDHKSAGSDHKNTGSDYNNAGGEPDVDRMEGGDRPARKLSAAAKRALAEAEQRRKDYREREAALPKELGGRGGNDPNRYGDWEIKGLTSDF